MPRHKEGTLVLVHHKALTAHWEHCLPNNNLVTAHGFVWRVVEFGERFGSGSAATNDNQHQNMSLVSFHPAGTSLFNGRPT